MYEKAFITGITGQDGSYLSEILLDKEYVMVLFGDQVQLIPIGLII